MAPISNSRPVAQTQCIQQARENISSAWNKSIQTLKTASESLKRMIDRVVNALIRVLCIKYVAVKQCLNIRYPAPDPSPVPRRPPAPQPPAPPVAPVAQ
ncbi:MAG TPA: hypothetical protein VLF94_01340, partial [Chlamydiales bacterium]|nr:hypothetical protein [Chlamydiales bacterium]